MSNHIGSVEGRTGHAQGVFSDAQLLGAVVDTSEDAIIGVTLVSAGHVLNLHPNLLRR